jgi:hypothetical protein
MCAFEVVQTKQAHMSRMYLMVRCLALMTMTLKNSWQNHLFIDVHVAAHGGIRSALCGMEFPFCYGCVPTWLLLRLCAASSCSAQMAAGWQGLAAAL